tara:strand:+ start:1895 stop:2599 length:705 start_codon:yes stop_codon:yes gene_type:complete
VKQIYSGDNNWVFDTTVNVENEFLLGSIGSAANDMYWRHPKEDISLFPHDAGAPHPTNPLMVKNIGCHIVTSGLCDVTYSWTEEDDLDLDHLRNYAHYIETVFPEKENAKEHSIRPNGYHTLHMHPIGSVTEFSPIRPEYILKADRVGYLRKGSSLMCVIRSAPNTDEWFTTYRDAQAGETITLEPFGSKTYFVFGSVVKKNGQDLQKHKAYKATREIEITCPEFTKIVRVHQK